jgi:hypothetical protein
VRARGALGSSLPGLPEFVVDDQAVDHVGVVTVDVEVVELGCCVGGASHQTPERELLLMHVRHWFRGHHLHQHVADAQLADDQPRPPTGIFPSAHAPVARHHGMKTGSAYVRHFRRVFHGRHEGSRRGVSRVGGQKIVPPDIGYRSMLVLAVLQSSRLAVLPSRLPLVAFAFFENFACSGSGLCTAGDAGVRTRIPHKRTALA